MSDIETDRNRKDWAPPFGPSFLSVPERERLKSIQKDLAKGSLPVQDYQWLCSVLRKLGTLTALDFDFPSKVLAVDRPGNQAFTLQFVGRANLNKKLILAAGAVSLTFVHKIEVRVCDAIVFVRPHIRLRSRTSEKPHHELLAGWGASLEIKGARQAYESRIFEDWPLETWLLGPDGYGLVRIPFSFQGLLPSSVLTGHRPARKGTDTWAKPMPEEGDELGVFLAKDDELRIAFSGPSCDEEVELRIGFVAGNYTVSPTI